MWTENKLFLRDMHELLNFSSRWELWIKCIHTIFCFWVLNSIQIFILYYYNLCIYRARKQPSIPDISNTATFRNKQRQITTKPRFHNNGRCSRFIIRASTSITFTKPFESIIASSHSSPSATILWRSSFRPPRYEDCVSFKNIQLLIATFYVHSTIFANHCLSLLYYCHKFYIICE